MGPDLRRGSWDREEGTSFVSGAGPVRGGEKLGEGVGQSSRHIVQQDLETSRLFLPEALSVPWGRRCVRVCMHV